MLGSRVDRVADLVKKELSDLIVLRLKDPRVGFVTLTVVEMSKDLKFARVHYSVMGPEKIKKSTQAALEHAHGFLQKELSTRLRLRLTPQLQFFQDNAIEAAMQMDKIFKEIESEGQKAPRDN